MIWPFTRTKPSADDAQRKFAASIDRAFAMEEIIGIKPIPFNPLLDKFFESEPETDKTHVIYGEPHRPNDSMRALGKPGFLETLMIVQDDGTVAPFFDRDDLHALIVQTLVTHGGKNTYELADAIVDAIVEGSRS